VELFKVCLPLPDCGIEDLYIRKRSGVAAFKGNQCFLDSDSEISTDTYFNIFSSSKYSKYTRVRNVSVTTLVSGKLDIELCSVSSSGEKIIESKSVDSDKTEEVTFSFNISGLEDCNPTCHYLLYHSYGDSIVESFGSYISDLEPDYVNLGVVICTFKREDRIIKSINRINRLLSDKSYEILNNINVYVVDNGSTLDGELINNNFIKLIPSRNDGGSGGFTRGMIECRNNHKTHILMMDDDIVFDPNTIYKTFKFVSVLNDRNKDVFVLGGMLLPESPGVQFEAGARYINGFERGKHMLDMVDVKNLLVNDKWEYADYGGWWYICMPMDATDELPLPMFIKMDDVEFGIRRMKSHVIMNGIGIWHDSFESKVNPVINYYFLRRNTLIVWILYNMRNGPRVGLEYLQKMMYCIKNKDYDEFFYTHMAVKDFMIGPDFIKNVNQAELLRITNPLNPAHFKNVQVSRVKFKIKPFMKIFSVFLQSIKLSIKWNKLKEQYVSEARYLSSYEFWANRQ
jgi:galactofuranosylgalactofuranosylrhamnosyl-N-acetylglucosaminyl-diphospho-decaprenol beta-1,5/1,6-galactofuranosyltransferase